MRPIDADALKDFINRQLAMTASTSVVMNAKDFFENIVDNAPTIELLRCGDCIHYNSETCLCYYHNMRTTAEWFCADGERRTIKAHRLPDGRWKETKRRV